MFFFGFSPHAAMAEDHAAASASTTASQINFGQSFGFWQQAGRLLELAPMEASSAWVHVTSISISFQCQWMSMNVNEFHSLKRQSYVVQLSSGLARRRAGGLASISTSWRVISRDHEPLFLHFEGWPSRWKSPFLKLQRLFAVGLQGVWASHARGGRPGRVLSAFPLTCFNPLRPCFALVVPWLFSSIRPYHALGEQTWILKRLKSIHN